MKRRILLAALLFCACGQEQNESGVFLAMGFRVGEVTQDSAVVWTRVTRYPESNWEGGGDVGRPGPRQDQFVPPSLPVEDHVGAVPGAEGEVRLLVSKSPSLNRSRVLGWEPVASESDYTHHFRVSGLDANTRYYLRVDARSEAGGAITSSEAGTFLTPAKSDDWQYVRFGVITGQAYRSLDDQRGHNIYPAMGSLGLNFLVPTGDTIYYDSDAPRGRTIELARHHWHRMYSLPRLVEFHRSVPGYWEKDDHDTLANDVWPTQNPRWMLPMTFEDGLRLFREQVPIGDEVYRTIRWGRGLQVWIVEGRDFRSPNTMEDGPEKTIWGFEQRDWLMRTILESDADFKVLISPTPIVGPDRSGKKDNHANTAFAWEGNLFRNWTREQGLGNLYVACGDRHWQYMSVDPKTGLREFSCGPASDIHAGGSPGHNPGYQPFHRVAGGFLTVTVTKEEDLPIILFRFHDVDGEVVFEFKDWGEA